MENDRLTELHHEINNLRTHADSTAVDIIVDALLIIYQELAVISQRQAQTTSVGTTPLDSSKLVNTCPRCANTHWCPRECQPIRENPRG